MRSIRRISNWVCFFAGMLALALQPLKAKAGWFSNPGRLAAIPQAAVNNGGSVPNPNKIWYKLDRSTDSGTTATDSSAAGDNGTYAATPSYVQGQDTIANHAVSFDGSVQSISFTRITPSTTFTVAMWIKPVTTGISYQALIYDESATQGLYLHDATLDWYDGSDHATGSISTSNWTHVAMVCNAGTSQIYINGSASGSTFSVTSTGFNTIGQRLGGGMYDGYIDDVRVWSSALTSGQISTLASNGAQ